MYSIFTALLGLAAIGESAIVRPRIAPRDIQCYSGVYIIYARGTGEPQGASLSNIIANAIVAAIPDSASNQVVYPANFSSNSPTIGTQNTIQQVTDYYNACPCSDIVLMGYSQGARVVGNAVAGGNASTIIPQSIGKNIISIVMFGDPDRVLGQGVDNEPGSCNVSSAVPRSGAQFDEMAFYADRLDEYCAAGDPVCCATGNDFGAHLSYFNDDNAAIIGQYVSGKYNSSVICSSASASASIKASSTASRSSAKSASASSSLKSASISASASISKTASWVSNGKPASASLSNSGTLTTSTSRVKPSACPAKSSKSSSGKAASVSTAASSGKASSGLVKSVPSSTVSSLIKTSAVVSSSAPLTKSSSTSGSASLVTSSSPAKSSTISSKASSTAIVTSSIKLVSSTSSSKKSSSTSAPLPFPTGYGWGNQNGGGWFHQVFGGLGW